MNILYGLAGEGFGHSSRALTVIPYLIEKGHKVKVITYGQAYEVLKDKFDVFKVEGLTIIFEERLLKKRRTLFHNLKYFSRNVFLLRKIKKMIKEFKPNLCISDMEPLVPMIRRKYRLPLVCLDNQHRITNLEIDVPKKYFKDYLIAKEIIKSFVRIADYYVITSFSNLNIKEEYSKNTFIVPPIIRKEIKESKVKSRRGKKILVYLTKEDKKTIRVLKRINEEFVIYGYDVKRKEDNLYFKTRESFLKDFINCKAVIATAGFTLISESLFLKKPYLALPLKGQFEQVLNAIFLKKSGLGDYTEEITKKKVQKFISKFPVYNNNLKKYEIDSENLYRTLDKILNELN